MFNELKSDCKNCFGLCCVALPFGKSADFPYSKEGGIPCQNLCSNNSCAIHDLLRERGFRGCVSYECFGAGQHVSQFIYKGEDWRRDSGYAGEMFAVFPLIQQLHEMLWYLKQALSLKEAESFKADLQEIYEETVDLTRRKPKEILEINLAAHRSNVNVLLVKVSEIYRKDIHSHSNKREIKKDSDFIGKSLYGRRLQGEDFRGKIMIESNLSYCDLSKADFIGADLRNADLRSADLTDALFLTQSQINSAIGDIHTKLPSYLEMPSHWNG
ncbi:pentapeptide repeat-containing protein [Ornithinibacillus bavariensis]|uniref:pentapeptide repeat-containing protein n=1 Tax=Ornithinibacillus bavariensis TaxID=545502 RepID=UPI000EBDE295|nr:hypothetical protein [Ornithinibacillus sp.]